MKNMCLLLCLFFAACGAKSNEEIAKGLILEKMKATYGDTYEPVNFSNLGISALPYEETSMYKENRDLLNNCKDSVASLEAQLAQHRNEPQYQSRLQLFRDSLDAVVGRSQAVRQGYTPEKLFRLTHAYIIKEKSGKESKFEDAFFIDTAFTKVVKSNKLY